MSESSIRPRDKTDAYNFDNLMSQGLEWVQALSGDVWTDYNLHDPGVTLLEQLCFALTDVVYRSDREVVQYLINEKGYVDFSYQGLYGASKVLSSGPVKPEDFERLFLDKIHGLNNITLNSDNHHYGEFQLISGITAKQADETKNTLQALYHASRPLGQKVCWSFEPMQCEFVSLSGVIEIDSGFQVEAVLADVFLYAEQYISPAPDFISYDELLAQNLTMEEVLQGPFVAKGVLKTDKKRSLLASNLSGELMLLKGVKKVSNLQFTLENDQAVTLLENSDNRCFALAMPESDKKLHLQLNQNAKAISIDIKQFVDHIEQQRMRGRSKPFAMAVHHQIFPSIKQDYWPLDESYPISHQMPANYAGAGNHEISSKDKRQQAYNRQLNGYLMLFEQFIANNFANLSQVRTLFSVDEALDKSYFHKTLEHSEARNLYRYQNENILTQHLDSIIAQDDDFLDRRNRALDYLLGLYAETFPDDDFQRLDNSADERTIKRDLIRAKIALLKHIPQIGYRRSLGQDISKPLEWSTPTERSMNMSGVQLRASLMLGFWDITQHSLLSIYERLSLTITDENSYRNFNIDGGNASDKQALLNNYIKQNFYPAIDTIEHKDLTLLALKQLYSRLKRYGFFKDNVLNVELLQAGVKSERYWLSFIEKQSVFFLLLQVGENQWLKLGEYYNKSEAVQAAELFQTFLFNFHRLDLINQSSELQRFPLSLVYSHLLVDLLAADDIYDKDNAIDNYIRRHFRPAVIDTKNDAISISKMQDLLTTLQAHNLLIDDLSIDFLTAGADASRYRIGYAKDKRTILLAFRFGDKRWVKLAHFNDASTARNAASLCQQFLYAVNRLGEGLHIIEHTLLSVNAEPEDSYQISVLLPDWPVRFSSRDFKLFVEAVLQQSCPAHIYCNVCWLNFQQMNNFETVYRQWYEQLMPRENDNNAQNNSSAIKTATQALIEFLDNVKKNTAKVNAEMRGDTP